MSSKVQLPSSVTNPLSKSYETKYKDVHKFVENLNKLGQTDGYMWNAEYKIGKLYMDYLYKKYDINCNTGTGKLVSDLNIFYPKIKEITGFEDYGNLIFVDTKLYEGKENEYKKYLNKLARRIVRCIIQENNKTLPIDINLRFNKNTSHANLLIFRKNVNEAEIFEPYGKATDTGGKIKEAKINKAFQLLINEINKVINSETDENINFNLKYTSSICPRLKGLQTLEATAKERTKNDGNNYCLLWSIFVTELVLNNPNLSTSEILSQILQKKTDEDISLYLLKVARGYSKIISDKIEKYFSDIFGIKLSIPEYSKIINGENRKQLLKVQEILYNYFEMEHTMFKRDFTLQEMEQYYDERKNNFLKDSRLSRKYRIKKYIIGKMKKFKQLTPVKKQSLPKTPKEISKHIEQEISSIGLNIDGKKNTSPSPIREKRPKRTKRTKRGSITEKTAMKRKTRMTKKIRLFKENVPLNSTKKNIKLIKLPTGRQRCPRHYRKHPKTKKYCIRERRNDIMSKMSMHETVVLREKEPIYIPEGVRRCPDGYRRNPKHKSECRYYGNWYKKKE